MRVFFGIMACCFAPFAAASDLSGNLLGGLSFVQGVAQQVCLFCAIVFFFAGLIKFKSYRQNPVQTPFSRCIILFVVALLLVGLAYIPSPLSGAG